jgi:aldose 1-epimerase
VSKNDSSIECFFSSAEYKDINWPWHFEARVRYHIGDTIFTSQVTLRNRSNASMPAGFGWHPYFNRSITRDYEPVYLRVKVAAAYPDAFGNRIPSGPPEQLTDDQDFTAEKILSRDVFLDTCFQGYDGNGTITWPDSRLRLTYDCSQECSHLIIFNPSYPYFAVEPVTNANNGVNLYSKGWPDSGIVSLAPGENLTARFSMKIELL